MKFSNKFLMCFIVSILSVLPISAYANTFEQAGKKVDATLEKAGQSIDKSSEKAKKTVKKIASKIKEEINDGLIVSKIKMNFARDSLLNSFDISVSSEQGVVSLAGQVKTDAEYERAIMVANEASGVQDVIADNLTVEVSNQPIKDTYITGLIKGKILQKKLFTSRNSKAWTVNVETKDGVVTLTGRVNNEQNFEALKKLITTTKGVKGLNADAVSIEQ